MSIWSLIFKKKPEKFCVNCEYCKDGIHHSIKNLVCRSPHNNRYLNMRNKITGEKEAPHWRWGCCSECRCDHMSLSCGPKGKWFKSKQRLSRYNVI